MTARVQLLAFTLLALFLAFTLVLLDSHTRDAAFAEVSDELDTQLSAGATRILRTTEQLRRDALLLAQVPPIQGLVRAAANRGFDARDRNRWDEWELRLQEIFSAYAAANPECAQVRYIGVAGGGRELVGVDRTPDGRIAVAPPAALQAAGERDYFRAAARLAAGRLYLSEIELAREHSVVRTPHVRTLRAATPVYAADGKLFGIVAINWNIGALLDEFARVPHPANTLSYVADQYGRYLAAPEDGRASGFDPGRDDRIQRDIPALTPLFAPDAAAKSAFFGAPTELGDAHFLARRVHFDPGVPERFLVLVYRYPDAALAPVLAASRGKLLLGGLLAGTLMLIAMLLLIRRAFAPLAQLTAAAEAFSRGARSVALPAQGWTDIRALTEAFAHMLRSIADKENALTGLNADLEQRVLARTAELRMTSSVYENTSEGAMISDEHGVIVGVNPAFTEITGYSAEEAIGNKPSLLKSEHHEAAFYRTMWATLLDAGRWQGEVWNRRKSGEAYLEWLTINRIPEAGGLSASYVAVFRDITDRHRADERVHHLAFHDALTGLPNRALFQERLAHAVERARRDGGQLSVTFIDLDGFKAVNDSLGHDTGDLLLQEAAARIQSFMRRGTDTVARLGGDEFVVLMEDLGNAECCAGLADEMLVDIARPMTLKGHTLRVGASMGMAFYPQDGGSALALMQHADTAMYAAKAAGKNTYRFFCDDMLHEVNAYLALENDLRDALERNELVLHYQPKVCLTDGRMLGVEALVRWQHPRRGLLQPAEFIALAEKTGLILPLGDWVLAEACRQAALWVARNIVLPVAVNVSPQQIEKSGLAERVQALLAEHGLPATALQIELTETTLMADPERVSAVLQQLHRVGVVIAIDDFGTGYSSLSRLRHLPIDLLKIDKSFVTQSEHDAKDALVVRTVIALAQSLGLDTIAEGVESEGQATLLRDAGCVVCQGYLYAHPKPPHELEGWLGGVAPTGMAPGA
ncbi:MAG: EAL domain-containing protein [Betaproteobacteria bacterium]|nr:EAL domain-containing protein [Betaproteobacteria bacterium]